MSLNPPIADWRGLRCWIIGASSGIGASLAERLGTLGACVALSARRAEALEQIASRFADGTCLVLPLDLRNSGDVAEAARTVVARWGAIDLVVVMAGDYKPMRAWEIELATARSMLDTNVMGAYNAIAAVVPSMIRAKAGTIALVSSVAGYRGLPKSLVYGPTKAALINLAEALYMDLRPRGIGVCVVNPGFVKTPLTANNRFRMPALIGAETAAREIMLGLERGEFEIHFPKRFTRVVRLLRLMPYAFYFAAIRRLTAR
jgi:NADP-dependent 3-hydroxy acid dehydrogenase YdfG